ncbi:hypothetical protein S7335_921 [Synechococcus sp. PCC 7335]|uniref:hypothetical protein n=1 Tax=Synechococcus sp. (strain ATCC 29403 / PCC 7335) TaxID=91464 RepID=UPI00017ECF31|nr:hypothetical protein [Synechococcus sp. PCC 7335]EDX82620.1 hypothetical protein S7335_921 [Synechococcus sp. PCC 7335]
MTNEELAAQQQINTANIADLITLSENVLNAAQLNTTAIAQLTDKIDETNQRFEVLRSAAIADRQRSDERFDRMLPELRGIAGRIDNLEGTD